MAQEDRTASKRPLEEATAGREKRACEDQPRLPTYDFWGAAETGQAPQVITNSPPQQNQPPPPAHTSIRLFGVVITPNADAGAGAGAAAAAAKGGGAAPASKDDGGLDLTLKL